MKKLNKIQVGVAVLALATVFSPLAEYLVPTASAASFNQGSQPYKMIRGYNYSEKGSCACWQDGDIEAEVGDIVTFRVFYNDTSSETARETRVQVVPTSLSGQTATMTGRVWADNASTVTDTIRVRVPSGQEITDLDPIAVFWYDGFQNQMSLGGQSPSQVTSSSGLDVNDTLPGLENARFVVARFEIEGEEIDEEEEGDAPDVTTLSATDIDTDDARLQGEVDPNGDSTDAWFEWGTSSFDLDEETGSSSVGSGDTTRSFSFRIDDLEPGETYFFRAVARNDFGTDFGSIKSFTTDEEDEEEEGDAPEVTTLSATDIDTDDARLQGEVDPNGDSTDAWFEWGTSSFDLDEETSHQSAGSGTTTVDFDEVINDLEPGETYFFRAVGENDLGTDFGSIKSFTTDEEEEEEEEGDAPEVTTLSATGINTDSARLQGEVDPNGDSTDAWFEWGTSSSDLDEETDDQSTGDGTNTVDFSEVINDLEPGETYFFRAVARNDFGTDFGSIKSFTTDEEEEEEEGDAPDVITLSATDINTNDACLRGEVDPNGDSTDAWFEWGTSSFDLDEETDDQSVGSGTSVRSFSFCLDDLEADETYFFRAVAENDLGDDLGSIRSFTTDEDGVEEEEVGPPDATTLSATGITSTSAALRGEVNPNNDQTDTWFEWGTTRSLSRKTGDQSIGSGDRDVSVSFVLTGLSPSTTYFYRVAAENDEGDDRGSILSFQTTASVVIPPVTTVIERIVTVFRGEEEREEPEIIITLKSDKTGLADKDHEIVYTVSYENRTDRTFTDVSLEVRLPEDGIDLVDSNPESDDIRGDTLVFDIGTISPREEDEFEITIQVEDPEVGQDIILSASLSYVNPDNVRNVVTVEDIDEITEGDLTGVGLTARILDSLGDFFTNPIFWFLIFLALFFLAYRYLVYMRRRNLPMQQAPLTPPPAP